MSGIICTAIGSPATAALLPSGGKDRAQPGLAAGMTSWWNPGLRTPALGILARNLADTMRLGVFPRTATLACREFVL